MNITSTAADNTRAKAGVKRMSRYNLRVDMTPMVDLGFLLITFFILTTEMAKPSAMNLYMPKDNTNVDGSELAESKALTVLLDGDKIFYYHGKWEDAVKNNTVKETGLAGDNSLRTIITAKQQKLDAQPNDDEGRNGLMMLIKPGSNASYKQLVAVMDEALITMLKKYAIIKITDEEKTWMERHR